VRRLEEQIAYGVRSKASVPIVMPAAILQTLLRCIGLARRRSAPCYDRVSHSRIPRHNDP